MSNNDYTDNSRLCTVLVSTCDKYEEAWAPFFSLFNKYWHDCPFDIALNTETKYCNVPMVKTYNNSGNWCSRLRSALSEIETPFILFFLEDFFLQAHVRTSEVLKCIDYLNDNPNIACFYQKRIADYHSRDDKYSGFMRMYPNDSSNCYMLSTQVGIWRKDVLSELLCNTSDPWEFEVDGYIKNKDIIDKYEFYCHRSSYHDVLREEDIFPYLEVLMNKGYGIRRSVWLWNNKKLFRKNNVPYRFHDLKKMSYIEYLFTHKLGEYADRVKKAVLRRLP